VTRAFESLTGLVLRSPALALLALLLPAAVLLRRRRPPALAFAPAWLLRRGAGSAPPRTWRVALLRVPTVLGAAAVLAVAAALARPAVRVARPLETEGIDVVLALDTSSSMTAADMEAGRTRLEVAKEAAARFVRRRPHDRIGLVSFARFPDLRCPPTLDHEALVRILGEVAPVEGDDLEDATGIGAAVARSAQVLAASPARSRVLVLLTDGEETVSDEGGADAIAPEHAAQLAERLGVRAYVVVAGTGRLRGAAAPVPADTSRVERLATRTGGALLRAPDAQAMERVYAAVDALETTTFEEPADETEDRALPFLAVAAGLLLLSRGLARTTLEVRP
jgi:Ca-activated chloride channel family protein